MGSGYLVRRGVVGGSSEATVTFDIQNVKIFRKGLTSLINPVYNLDATTVGDYALFGGGNVGYSGYNSFSLLVNAYDSNLVRSIPTSLSVSRGSYKATTVGDYALFGGGNGYSFPQLDVYNASLIRSNPTALSEARSNLEATTVGNYALFAGGVNTSSTTYVNADAYSDSLTKTVATSLSQARAHLAATTVGKYALFAGGRNNWGLPSDTHTPYATVDTYDTSLTMRTITSLANARSEFEATTVGNYAIFAGGVKASQYTLTNYVVPVEVYTAGN